MPDDNNINILFTTNGSEAAKDINKVADATERVDKVSEKSGKGQRNKSRSRKKERQEIRSTTKAINEQSKALGLLAKGGKEFANGLGIGKWIGLGAVSSATAMAIKSVEKSRNLILGSIDSGIAPKKLDTLGVALKRFGGNAASAASASASIRSLKSSMALGENPLDAVAPWAGYFNYDALQNTPVDKIPLLLAKIYDRIKSAQGEDNARLFLQRFPGMTGDMARFLMQGHTTVQKALNEASSLAFNDKTAKTLDELKAQQEKTMQALIKTMADLTAAIAPFLQWLMKQAENNPKATTLLGAVGGIVGWKGFQLLRNIVTTKAAGSALKAVKGTSMFLNPATLLGLGVSALGAVAGTAAGKGIGYLYRKSVYGELAEKIKSADPEESKKAREELKKIEKENFAPMFSPALRDYSNMLMWNKTLQNIT